MSEIVITLSIVFVTAGLFLLVANQLEFPSVPFYIVAGLVVGQFVQEPALVDLALWGVAFLVFVFGIRVDLGDVRSVIRDAEIAAFAQLLVVAPIAFGIGYGLGTAFGFEEPFRNALYFSAAATLSSTLVGVHRLEAEIRDNLVHGRLAAAVHFFDDLVAVGALLVFSAEVLTDAQLITSKIGYGVLFLLAGLLLYRHGFPVLVRVAGGDDELVLMGSISILIAFIAAAEAVGISIVVGAFAAGLAVRTDHEVPLGVHNGVESIRDFFVAIFFVTIGALVSIPTFEVLVLGGVLVGLVVAINPLIHAIAFVAEGYDARTAFLTGSNLNQVSELGLVIALQAWLFGTIADPVFDGIVLAAAVTMIVSASARRYEHAFFDTVLSRVLPERTTYIDEHSAVEDDLEDHVVLVGYGRQTRRLVDLLEERRIPYVVVENDPTVRDDLVADCRNYVFGDATASYPMKLARVGEATLVVSSVDYRPVSEAVLGLKTDADVILRADTSRDAAELLDSGATFVTVPSVLASDQLIETVERVLADEREAEKLEADHRAFLERIERLGLERQFDRR